VPEDSRAIITSCGTYKETAPPGFICIIPVIRQYSGSVNMRIWEIDAAVTTKTKDNVFVRLTAVVMYKVQEDDVYHAFYSLMAPKMQIRANISDVLRANVPMLSLDELFEAKEKLADEVQDHLTAFLRDYGYTVVDSLITDIEPDVKVKAAMNMINESRRKREAAKEKAEAQKIETVVKAEAEAEAQYLRGKGIADQRRAIIAGMQSSVSEFQGTVKGVSPKDVMEIILMSQYFDTLKELSQNSTASTIFIPHNVGSVTELCDDLQAGILSGGKKAIAM